MENKGLLFIPDISGFSRFVAETDIGHSRLIIQELLEILINANEIGLEISEIEGDAILFYKFGDPPSLEALYRQVEKMFCAFHKSLMAYDQHRYCQCKACVSAKGLTLKVVTHYGEFTGYHIQNFKKLIGKDLIVAHQLLKNDIPEHEYWIITHNLSGETEPVGFAQWMRWDSSIKRSETGDIPFHYTQLGHLKSSITADGPSEFVLDQPMKVVSVEKEYETDIITLFHAAGDFRYRSQWQQGVQNVEIVDHFLPRVGMKCRYVMDGKTFFMYSGSYQYQDDHIEFSETDEKKESSTWFTLQRLDNKRTKLTLDFFVRTSITNQLMFRLFKKRQLERAFRKSLENLSGVVKDLKIPSALEAC
jgi:hypothetical protein